VRGAPVRRLIMALLPRVLVRLCCKDLTVAAAVESKHTSAVSRCALRVKRLDCLWLANVRSKAEPRSVISILRV
jgi:hypothetical protein